jgi:hypothetical protein
MASSVEGVLNAGYIASNTFINKRDIRKKIFPRYNEQNLFDFMHITDRTKETDNTLFNWHELGYLYGYAQVLSYTGGAAPGVAVVVTITVASHQEAGTKSSGKQWDLVLLGGIRGWVQTKNATVPNAHVYTIKPVRSTDTFPASPALANKVIAFFSTAKADGTGQAGSMVRKPDRFYNTTQIISTQFMAYGSESANKAEVEINGKPYFYLQGEEDAATKHNTDMNFAFVLGEGTDATTPLVDTDNAGEVVNTTKGMEAFIRDFGNNVQWTTIDLAFMQGIEKILNRERAPVEMLMINGVNIDVLFDQFVNSEVGQSGIRYDQFGNGNAAARAVDFGFNSFRFSKHIYHKQCADFMNYSPVTGNAVTGQNSPYPDMSLVGPLDKVANPKPVGALDDDYIDTLCCRFKRNDRQNRFIKHWTRDVTITNQDRIEFNYLSDVGLMMARLNQWIRIFK